MTARMVRFDDEYANRFNEFIASTKGDITIVKDPNLEYDPYFYERKASLDKTIEAVDNGTMKMSDFNKSIDNLIEQLEKSV
jgi:hypothetical protein